MCLCVHKNVPARRCRRHLIRVASHFRSALPLGSSKNGWYGIFGVSGRAVGTRYTAADNRVPKGTLSVHILDPAIKMAGYPYQMPTASSRGDVFMNTETQRHRVFLLSAEPSISVPLCLCVLFCTRSTSGRIYTLRALKKNIKKQEKQEKTMMVLFCFWGFILFFIRPLADFVPFSQEKEIPAAQNVTGQRGG